jgi:CDP-glycerol glycerophosphotransferase (TagB/SpsB family)
MAAAAHIKQQIPSACFIEPSTDPYPLLRLADILLTDYSSIALDYLLLDRPILFYWPDHADYQRQSRNLLPEFEHYTVGDKAMDGNVLRHNIEATLAGNDPWVGKRRELIKQLYDYQDGQAGDRVARLILEQLDMPEQLPDGWGI